MKLYEYKTREEYVATQIERSRAKTQYCKVFFSDVIRYKQLLRVHLAAQHATRAVKPLGPILCLGVRSGAEVDLFRSVFFGPLLNFKWVRQLAVRWDTTTLGSHKTRLARILGLGNGSLRDGKVIGVEIAPEVNRPDIWIGSFDELPAEWAGKFRVLYSNSIDHAQDPERTVAEWKRVAAPGAYVILAFTPNQKSSAHDPIGGMGLEEWEQLWKAPVVFSNTSDNAVGYSEICFQL